MTFLSSKLIGIAATAVMLFSLPLLSTAAEAHQQGSLCRYQVTDSQGYVKTRVARCHHLPTRPPKRPRDPYSEEQVCFVTFFERSQVSGGADADVEQARLFPKSVAVRRDRPNDRNRIFTYGSQQKTRQTCNYLDNLDNDNAGNDDEDNNNQDLVCLVTFFDSSQVGAGADATVERATLLPRDVAERRDGPDDRNRIFEYGSQQKTRETCSYLDGLNN